MLNGLFKKKISIAEASGLLVSSVMERCKNEWAEDSKEIIQYLGEITENEFNNVPFEISLAVASMELQAIKNLSPDFFSQVNDNVLAILCHGEWEEYVHETITQEYIPCFKEALEKKLHPAEEVTSILAYKIDYDLDSMSGMVLMHIIVKKLGTWKLLIENYKIVN